MATFTRPAGRRAPGTARSATRGRGAVAPLVGVVAGGLLLLAAFLPWYAADIAPPFEATASSGWSATIFARLASLCGLVVAAGSLLPLVVNANPALTASRRSALAFTVAGAAIVGAVLVAFRLVVLPDPADLLSRQIGLYVAMAAAVACVIAGIGQASQHSE